MINLRPTRVKIRKACPGRSILHTKETMPTVLFDSTVHTMLFVVGHLNDQP